MRNKQIEIGENLMTFLIIAIFAVAAMFLTEKLSRIEIVKMQYAVTQPVTQGPTIGPTQ